MTEGKVTIELVENPISLDVNEENVLISLTEQPVELEIIDEENVLVSVTEQPVELEIINSSINIVVSEQIVEVDIGTSGPQGIPGPTGPAGSADPSQLAYVHTQNVASQTWNIVHGLNFIPNITVVDSGGTVVEGSYNYPNSNTVVLSFSSAFSGKAYLS